MYFQCKAAAGRRSRPAILALASAGAAIVAGCLPGAAAAAGSEPRRTGDGGAVAIVVENDLFGRGSFDRDYTSGLEASYLGPAARSPGWTSSLVRLLTDETDENVGTRLHFGIGQQIFTPDDIAAATPDPDDRPYAGLLYGSVGAIVNVADRRFDQVQLLFGVAGPASLAGDSQIFWHRIIDGQRPNGWRTQISNRPFGEVSWRRSHVVPVAGEFGGPGFGVVAAPHYGLRAGNLETSASLGGELRVGFGLPVAPGAAHLEPGQPGAAYFRPTAKAGGYLFAGVDGRYVARDLTLDVAGRNGAGVSRLELVGDLTLGMVVYRGRLRVSYTQIFRSRQYDEQSTEGSEYGSLGIALNF